MKQFNPTLLMFDDPVIRADGEDAFFDTHGDGWFLIKTQDEINAISNSITHGGIVWEENGEIKCSGAAPSPAHQFKNGKWEICPQAQAAILAKKRTALLQSIAEKTDAFKAQYLLGYSQAEIDSFYRQEREARNELPLMLLSEIFEGRSDLETIDQLKAKVIEKADIFAIIMGKLFAIKQSFEKRIENAETQTELDEIEKEVAQWQKL